MCLILEHEQPSFEFAVHVHIYIYAAGVVLLADLHVVEKARLAEITSSDGSHIHEVQPLMLTAKFLSHLEIQIQCPVDVFFHEGLLHSDFLQLCSESGMTAVVAPVCVENTEFSFVRVTSFF